MIVNESATSIEKELEQELIKPNTCESSPLSNKMDILSNDEIRTDTKHIITEEAPINEENFYSDTKIEFNIKDLTNIKKSNFPVNQWAFEARESVEYIRKQIKILDIKYINERSKKVEEIIKNSILPELCVLIDGNKIIVNPYETCNMNILF